MFIRIILAVVATFIPTLAIAQTTSPEVRQAIEFCQARHLGATSTAILKQEFCISEQKLLILEALVHKGDQGLVRQVEELKGQLEAAKAAQPASPRAEPTVAAPPPSTKDKVDDARAAIDRRVAEIRAGKAKPVQPAEPSPPPSQARPAVPSQPSPTFVGVPYHIVPTPGQFAAATYDIDGPRLWLQSLHRGVDKHAWGADAARVVVKKNGVPLVIAQANGRVDAIYGDLNADGKEERTPYAAVDPFVIDDLYIPQVGPRDKIEVVYLVPTGKLVARPGFPPQILWGDPVRVRLDSVQRMGRWVTHTTGGWRL